MRFVTFSIGLCLFHVCPAADKAALFIGNTEYQHATRLPNAINDASAMESKLKEAGYQTFVVKNAGIDALTAGLEEFYTAAKGAEVAVVFYAGHGIENDRQNYLLPTDARLTVDAGLEGDALLSAKRALLKRETLPLDTLLADLSRTGARLKLVVLDCCRDDPKLASRSWTSRGSNSGALANVKEETMPEGTMLVFSTAPGTTASDGTGSNSPFTTAVMQSLKPGFSISQVFTETAITMKGQEPYIRFDGSGKAMAAFGASVLLPGETAIPSRERQSMVVKVDGKERRLALIPEKELAEMRVAMLELKNVNRAFRLNVTVQDIGKKIQGIELEARNSLGVTTVMYDADKGNVYAGRARTSSSNWKRSHTVSDLMEAAPAYYQVATKSGSSGYQFFTGSKKWGYLLNANTTVVWVHMKDDTWLTLDTPGANNKPNLPDYLFTASARLALDASAPPITYTEAVLIFYQP